MRACFDSFDPINVMVGFNLNFLYENTLRIQKNCDDLTVRLYNSDFYCETSKIKQTMKYCLFSLKIYDRWVLMRENRVRGYDMSWFCDYELSMFYKPTRSGTKSKREVGFLLISLRTFLLISKTFFIFLFDGI